MIQLSIIKPQSKPTITVKSNTNLFVCKQKQKWSIQLVKPEPEDTSNVCILLLDLN